MLSEELRASLKRPLGKLLPGDGSDVYDEIARLISVRRPARVIFVGDAVSRSATAAALRRDILIVDNREMRTRTKPLDASERRLLRVRNEPGTISLNAWAAVEDAIQSGNAVMVVSGEEDLLTLVAIAVAPLGSFVIYGQPGEGVVLVEVDDEARKRALCTVGAMTRVG